MSVFVEELRPSFAEQRFYEEHGWLLTTLRVAEPHLAACRSAVEDVYAGRYDRRFAWSADKGNAAFGQPYVDRSQARLDAYVSHHKLAIQRVLWSPQLAAYAADLMQTSEVRLFRDVLMTMPAQRGHHTGLHVDKNYWPTCSSENLITAWFSLDDCDEADGCLLVVDGSHRWPATRFVRKLHVADIPRLCELYGKQTHEVKIVPVAHARGQVSFHSCRLVHGSRPNIGPTTRQSLAVVLQDAENRYVVPADAADLRLVQFNTNDRIGPKSSDGLPDYRDAEFYPTLYSIAPGRATRAGRSTR